MKVDLALSKSLFEEGYYVVINDEYYICIDKEKWFDLAKYLKINVEDNENERNSEKKIFGL